MARKRRVFFHPLFVFLNALTSGKRHRKTQVSGRNRSSLAGYIGLVCLTALLCTLAVPVLSQTFPAYVSSGAIAPVNPTNVQQVEQQARDYYAANQWDEAATAFEQAAQQYAALGDIPRQSINLSNLSLSYQQLGLWEEAGQAIHSSITLVDTGATIPGSPARSSALAQALDIQGSLQLAQGNAEDAIDAWERATTLHHQLGHGDQAKESQINQARALQSLGLYSRAINILQEVLRPTAQSPLLLQDLSDIQPWKEAQENALIQLQERLQLLPVSPITVAALHSLGEGLEVAGNLTQAFAILKRGLAMAEALALPEAIATTQLSLGNITYTRAVAALLVDNMSVKEAVEQLRKTLSPVQRELQYNRTQSARTFHDQLDVALDYYDKAAQHTNPQLTQTQAQLNRLKLLIDLERWAEADTTIPSITALLDELPLNRATFDAHLNLAQSLIALADTQTQSRPFFRSSNYLLHAAQVLTTARQQAIALNNNQAESSALGMLGSVYQRTQQWDEAEALTRQALTKVNAVSVNNLPQTVNDVDLAYRWQRQLGQLRDKQGDGEGAIDSYETALTMLRERLRLDIASSNLNYQYSFNVDAQTPVHKELMDLLLRDENPDPKNLQRVREVSTSLLETQLTSFLQEPCNVATPQQVDTLIQEQDQKVALFYPVVLPDRLEVIVKLPGDGNLLHYREPVQEVDFRRVVNELKLALEADHTYKAVNDLAQQLYGWLIQPAEAHLQSHQVDTLVFTLDRRLQAIPMAVLYDGADYLIDKYAVSEILGLAFDGNAGSVPQTDLKIMAAGLSSIPETLPEEIRNNFQPLKNVVNELQVIADLPNISVTTLDNENFTTVQFNTRLNEDKFPIVHLATHGQFSVNPKNTFLLTYSTSDRALIDVDELASLFRVRGQIRLDSIELLVLNACETAAGEELATLGMAGTAVRAGAKSAIASLWTLDDIPSVDFTKYLYKILSQPNTGRAEALRQAQLELKKDPRYRHPRYWAPYILAGNWLPLTTSRSDG